MVEPLAYKKTDKAHVTARLYSYEMDFNYFGKEPVGSCMLATIPAIPGFAVRYAKAG